VTAERGGEERGRRAFDAQLVAFASEVGTSGPVAVAGAGTRSDLGGPLSAGTRVLTAPTGIIAHDASEMTVTVRAGTSVLELHAELARAGQRTALPDRGGTVGGALAVGEDDLEVRRVGRVRMAPLRLRFVSAEGRVVTGGGPTVKNVSGFDLPRLMVGALGTLGLLAEVTLRTDPLPAVALWLRSEGLDPFAAAARVFRPAAVLWDGRTTWLRLVGHAPDVAEATAALRTMATVEEVGGPPMLPPHRWSLRPSELRALDVAATGAFVASIGVGTVHAERPRPPRRPDDAALAVAARLKAGFDPTGRLNPGRDPARR